MPLPTAEASRRRIAFAVGDTTGHVMLPLAIAEAYQALVGGLEALFLAGPDGPGQALIARAGHTVAIVPGSALMRVGVLGQTAAIVRLVPGILTARRLLRNARVQLVIGSGGYASGAVLLAARSLGAATAIVEPNAVPGLANRLLGRVASRAYYTFPAAGAAFPPGRRVLTGTPIRASLVRQLLTERRPPVPGDPLRVLVISGSRGDAFLAARIPSFLQRLARAGLALDVRHQAGEVNAGALAADYASRGLAATVLPFVDDMAEAYGWADVAVARAGAGTLAELALAGLPALLVPLGDAAADHQSANARAYAGAGAAVWMAETHWNEDELTAQLVMILLRQDRWLSMSAAARQLARPDAARRIAFDCEATMQGRWNSSS